MLVITPPQIKTSRRPGATRQVNRKTAHNGKVFIVIMLKRLTDPSILLLNKFRKLSLTDIQLIISDKTKETDLLVGPTVHERYDLQLFTSEKKNTP